MQDAIKNARGLRWAGWTLGFGLGGFFDGIMLHQILQWHHLLSLVEGVDRIAEQIFWDGAFHVLMYVITAVGLWLLWRGRTALGQVGGRRLLSDVLLGFAVWQFVDVGFFHWVLGIHRIRVDVPNPLLWDVGWAVVVGGLPLLGAFALRRSGTGGGGPSAKSGRVAATGVAAAVLVGGPWAALPPPDARHAVVLFAPGVTDGQAWDAVRAAGGDILWQSRGIWAVRWPEGVHASPLYARGALLVSSSTVGAGCLAWARA